MPRWQKVDKIFVPRKEEQTTTNLSTQNRPPAEKKMGEDGGDWEGWRSGEERREERQQFLSARNAEEQYKLHFEFGGCPLNLPSHGTITFRDCTTEVLPLS